MKQSHWPQLGHYSCTKLKVTFILILNLTAICLHWLLFLIFLVIMLTKLLFFFYKSIWSNRCIFSLVVKLMWIVECHSCVLYCNTYITLSPSLPCYIIISIILMVLVTLLSGSKVTEVNTAVAISIPLLLSPFLQPLVQYHFWKP